MEDVGVPLHAIIHVSHMRFASDLLHLFWALLSGTILHPLFISFVLTSTKGSTSPSVYDFFEYMIGVLLIVGSYIGYKLVFRTKIRNLKDIDLQTGRRVLSEKEINLLRDYYAKPAWRRGLSYFQVW